MKATFVALLVAALWAPVSAQSTSLLPLPEAPGVAASVPDAIVPGALAPNSIAPAGPDLATTPLLARLALPPAINPIVLAPAPLPRSKVLDKKFLTLGILTFALTALDVEMTQHCLKRHTCEEMNPSLPRSHAGQYAVNTPVNFAVMYFSYRRRANGKWGWWIAPVVDIGAHLGGIGSNVRWTMGK